MANFTPRRPRATNRRKIAKGKSIFPTDEVLLKMLYLTKMYVLQNWTGRVQNWGESSFSSPSFSRIVSGIIYANQGSREFTQNSGQTLCHLPKHSNHHAAADCGFAKPRFASTMKTQSARGLGFSMPSQIVDIRN
jgi:hypothetical protein